MVKGKDELKKAFLLYHDYYPHIKELSDNQLGKLLRAIYHHELFLEEIELDAETRMAFGFIAADLRRNAEKYEESVRKRSEAGKKGMASRWHNKNNNVTSNNNTNNNVINVIEDNNTAISVITEITDNEEDEDAVNADGNDVDAEADTVNISESDNEIIQMVIRKYNEICVDCKRMKHFTPERKIKILNLLTKYSIDDIAEAFVKVNESIFLKGREWPITIDWIIEEDNFIKILEGKYDNTSKQEEELRKKRQFRELEDFYLNGGGM